MRVVSGREKPVVAIDGPAGSGKSTASRMLADRLGYVLVDTGALYRGVALAAKERRVSWDDADALGALTRSLDVRFEPGEGGKSRLFLDGADRSDEIRTPEISQGASKVSAHGPVREALLGLQRKLGENGGVVLEGRDIGTVVFPDAEVKVFLTASPEVRARRRVGDLGVRGIRVDYGETLAEIRERDERDSTRPIAPLRPADDATVLDTSDLELDEVVDRLERIARQAWPGRG